MYLFNLEFMVSSLNFVTSSGENHVSQSFNTGGPVDLINSFSNLNPPEREHEVSPSIGSSREHEDSFPDNRLTGGEVNNQHLTTGGGGGGARYGTVIERHKSVGYDGFNDPIRKINYIAQTVNSTRPSNFLNKTPIRSSSTDDEVFRKLNNMIGNKGNRLQARKVETDSSSSSSIYGNKLSAPEFGQTLKGASKSEELETVTWKQGKSTSLPKATSYAAYENQKMESTTMTSTTLEPTTTIPESKSFLFGNN